MLKVKPFKQSLGYCGPASLKMVLGYYGTVKSEKILAKLSKCSRKNGVEAESLIKAAKKFKFSCLIKDYSSINDIRKYVISKKIPIIVSWFSVHEGHYSVVVGIDRRNIYILDPEYGKKRKINLKEFVRTWFDFRNCPVRSKDELLIRRMVVIYP